MRNKLLILSVLWMLLSRCAREVIIDLPEEPPKVVVVCHFTEGQNFRARVTLSQSVNDVTKPELPQEVEATLSIDGEYWDRLKPDTTIKGERTYWESHALKIAKAGVEYAISVRVPGYPVAQSSSAIPAPTHLDHIVLGTGDITIEPKGENQSELRIPLELRVSDLPADGRYFAFNITHEKGVYESLHPPLLDYTEEVRTNFLADGRTISLLHDIPEPVLLVDENYWLDDRRTLYLVARIPFKPDSERPRRLFIEWRTLSEAFYRYHLSLSRQGGNLPLSEPDAVFNNITGGYGNFSGYSVTVDTIAIPEF